MSHSPKHCDLCGGGSFEIIARHDRRGGDLLTDLCLGCGLVSHHAIPTDDELAEFYGRQYRRAYHGETTPSARRVMRAWKNGQRLHRELASFLPARGADVFEVGAGIGCTVKVFEQHGHRACGIEPSVDFQRYAAESLRAHVSNESLNDQIPVPTYDAILLVHVIEHLRSPRASLVQLHHLLKPGGLLYVECPNLAAPFAPRGKLFHYAHIHNFTPQTMELLVRSCGFSIVQWLRDERDPDLAVVLRREKGPGVLPQPAGAEATREALNRYNLLTYHLRWNYVVRRMTQVTSYAWERLFAKRYVRRILENVAAEPSPAALRKAA